MIYKVKFQSFGNWSKGTRLRRNNVIRTIYGRKLVLWWSVSITTQGFFSATYDSSRQKHFHSSLFVIQCRFEKLMKWKIRDFSTRNNTGNHVEATRCASFKRVTFCSLPLFLFLTRSIVIRGWHVEEDLIAVILQARYTQQFMRVHMYSSTRKREGMHWHDDEARITAQQRCGSGGESTDGNTTELWWNERG